MNENPNIGLTEAVNDMKYVAWGAAALLILLVILKARQ